ncbi:MAG: hypothetical protein RBS80_31790 [Thermoguttaceae bacterium]|nr:hypothetical protein [Thermoguttaceae bacterium]
MSEGTMGPLEPFADGRDASGRFVAGNSGGPGNPHAKKVAKLRGALLSAVSQSDMRQIIRRLVQDAKGGDAAAARLILDRCLGPAEAVDVAVRLLELEVKLGVRT